MSRLGFLLGKNVVWYFVGLVFSEPAARPRRDIPLLFTNLDEALFPEFFTVGFKYPPLRSRKLFRRSPWCGRSLPPGLCSSEGSSASDDIFPKVLPILVVGFGAVSVERFCVVQDAN